jgi:hypothetical protein
VTAIFGKRNEPYNVFLSAEAADDFTQKPVWQILPSAARGCEAKQTLRL